MKIRTIGIDLAKEVFGLHAVDVHGQVLLHTRVPRKRLLSRLARLEPYLVGMEACGSAHYWAREIERLGHKVRLMSPQFVLRIGRATRTTRTMPKRFAKRSPDRQCVLCRSSAM
jgi:transposase